MKKTIYILLLLFINVNLFAQYNYRSPLDIPLSLSANFGELRPNHFHTGLDLKTQGVVNKNVYAIEDGFVSQIGVKAGGYGLVLYIDHPNGQTSVYAHLNSFSDKITKYLRVEQYSQERYTVDISNIEPNVLPVKKGELVAKSGNTGSSGGPHVHFELRNTKTETAIDPLPYFVTRINDNIDPELRGLAVYPIGESGVVNARVQPLYETIGRDKAGAYLQPQSKIEAWGNIGLGIYSIDRMNGAYNIYGVREVRLYCNNSKIFSSEISTIDFSTTRMINSFTDFDYWKYNKKFYMKSFIEPGNKLHIYDNNLKGYIDINQEKTYNFRYELEDVHGNMTTYSFVIEGRRQEIPAQQPCSLVMQWDKNNRYISDHFRLEIPKEYLYKNINFVLNRENSTKYYSQIYTIHTSYEPLDGYVDMSLQLLSDPLNDKKQYGVVEIDEKGKETWIGGEYTDEGFMTTRIRELGNTYAIYSDTKAPTILPVGQKNWTKNKKIIIRLFDDLSQIRSFKGTIDGEYALFEHDIKALNLTYSFDPERLSKGSHKLIFTATDKAGNTTNYETTFVY